jgi:hypothetical protein
MAGTMKELYQDNTHLSGPRFDTIVMKKDRKKKQPDRMGKASKIVILLVLLSAVIGFTLNMGFFSIFKTAEPGSYVVVDYTIRDDAGQPIITSSRPVVEDGLKKGFPVGFTAPLLLEVDATPEESIISIDTYYPSGTLQFALFASEIEAMNAGISGMHINEQTTVPFDFGPSLVQNLTAEQFEAIGGNFSLAQPGSWMPMGFVDKPIISVDNTTPEIPIRLARVIEKHEDEILLRYGYSTVDITIQEIRTG